LGESASTDDLLLDETNNPRLAGKEVTAKQDEEMDKDSL
jgi:hypothetical protein